MKILLIEDEKEMAYTIKDELSKDYAVELAFSGEEGEYLVHVNDYDAIILDYKLPGIDGITVCKKIRKDNKRTPILMLTGEDTLEKKVNALDAGVDDYLVKPFKSQELLARIRALLRRNSSLLFGNILSLGDLKLDIVAKTVTRGNKKIILKHKEFQLLEYLMRNAGKVITRDMILDHIWDNAYESLTNTIEVHINYLRKQIDKPFEKKLIKTIYGFGYKMEI